MILKRIIYIVLFLLLILISLQHGAIYIDWNTLMNILMDQLIPFSLQTDHPEILQKIIIDIRLPRALLAIMIGAGLGLIGKLLQTVTHNPLADPFLFGLSSGASTGVVFVMTISGEYFGEWTLPLAAFIGGLIAATCVLLIMQLQNTKEKNLILAGLTTAFLFSSITNFLIFYGDQRVSHSVLFWSLGSLGLATWSLLWLPAIGLIIILTFMLMMHRQLDGLLTGEITAQSLGIHTNALRCLSFIVASLTTAMFVAVSGVIGFVGLMIPHIALFAAKSVLHRTHIMACAYCGALILLMSDILSRSLLAPQELPIGMITSAIGAIFLLCLLKR